MTYILTYYKEGVRIEEEIPFKPLPKASDMIAWLTFRHGVHDYVLARYKEKGVCKCGHSI